MKNQEREESNGTVNETISSKSGSEKYENPELREMVPIEDTPFTAVRAGEKWFLTMGKYRLTEPMSTLDEIKEEARSASWWRILQIVNIMIKEHEEEKLRKVYDQERDGEKRMF